MALDAQRAAENALLNLAANGFVVDGEYSQQRPVIEAVTLAILEEIKANGLVIVSGGSSAGNYKIE